MAITVAAPRTLPQRVAFWLVAAVLLLLLLSSAAVSPLYPVYQEQWGFSPAVLTVVFGVYAAAVLTSLLLVGSLSDTLGRRRVIVGSVVVVIISLVIFAVAQGVGALIVARAVQGLAVGAATGALGAALIELAPKRSDRGTLVNSVAPVAGLAAGALGAGLLVQYAPAPTTLVYLILLFVFAVMLVLAVFLPETAPLAAESAGARAPIRPRRPDIPRNVRGRVAILSITVVVMWAIGGLYLSLGPSLVDDILGRPDRLVGGAAIATLAGIGALAPIVADTWPRRRLLVVGLVLVLAGMAVLLAAIPLGSILLFFAGTAVIGLGWGPGFLGAFRGLAGLAEPARRGELLAAVYVVAYAAMSLPALAAGVVANLIGLIAASTAFFVAVAALAVVALVLLPRPTPSAAAVGTGT